MNLNLTRITMVDGIPALNEYDIELSKEDLIQIVVDYVNSLDEEQTENFYNQYRR